MLVLNVGGVVDLSPVKNVSNILLLSQLGVVTGDILADIILGKQNPSGKLSTTWTSVNDYKFIKEFGNFDDTNYVEGLYVGYRYFDSEGIKPLFPFGFGQSYTSFSISKISLTNVKNEITIIVSVKNIGKYPGKEVVQVYVSPSQENIDKPYQSLVAFKKTPKIEPSNQVEMSLKFKFKSMERYDEKKAYYLLDKGKYIIRVGNSSDCTKVYGYIELDEDIVTKQLKNINCNPDFEDYKSEVTYKDDLTNVQKIKLTKEDFKQKIVEYKYDYDIPPQIEKLENEELAKLCIGNYKYRNKEKSFERESGLAGTTAKDVKGIDNYLKMADGPAGLRISRIFGINYRGYQKLSENPLYTNSFTYYETQDKISLTLKKNKDLPNLSKYSKIVFQYTTAIPIATALAQSFNVEFLEKCGDLVGKEMEIFDIHLWLAPGLNIHRNILCGRNFEYFSEDPLLSGKLAAAITRGVQSHKNRGTTIKHFAGNNQEFNRGNNNSKMSERALREIYLKGFQIAIKESSPYALMTSYNLINGIHTSHNSQLLINVLRNEWKYKGLVMTDWSHSYHTQYQASKYPPQNSFDIIKGGVNVMMPGGKNDYDLIIEKLESELLTRDDLLQCASKVYEITELLNNK
jgi:beta-glucosidase